MTELDALPPRRAATVLVGLTVGLFGSASSAMIVANTLPAIEADLGADSAAGSWVVVGSLLAMTVSIPLWGRLADAFDGKRVVQAAFVLFMIGCLGAGLAPGLGGLIATRALQGVAMGGILVSSQAVIARAVPGQRRAAYLGYLGATMSIASLCGPLIGGVLVELPGAGWRSAFFVLIPFALVGLVVVEAALPRRPGPGGFRIDAAGIALLALAVTSLLLLVTFGGVGFAWWSPQGLALGALGLFGALALVLVERRVADPVVDLAALAVPAVRWSVVGSVAIGAVMFSAVLYLSQYWQLGRGVSAAVTGLLVAPLLAATLVASIVSGHLVARGPRARAGTMLVGAILLTAGLAGLATVGLEPPGWLIVAAASLVGLGMGALMQTFLLVAQLAVGSERVGRTTSLVSMLRSLSGAAGVAVLGAVVASLAPGEGYPVAVAVAFGVAAAVSLGAVVASLVLGRTRDAAQPG
ncbi:MFS transporter [Agromyces mediolanus]|uniref:MFS transporter n=1 Tax=Agromyces mediolanus TaxID=41986 RepID=UPI00203F84EB|nr:MFS transporter [Agromyces mediolanus]MCM3657688.1 MFS transporter [Agromyces mediolanus]